MKNRLTKATGSKYAIGACLIIAALIQVGCTSLGYEGRSEAKIKRAAPGLAGFGFDPDNNELSLAIEHLLDRYHVSTRLLSSPVVVEQRGEKVYTYNEVDTRYVLRVRSEDLDTCIPEGSRQMHFDITVIDYLTRKRVLIISGNFGCKDTIVQEFEDWLVPALEQQDLNEREEDNREQKPDEATII